MLKTNQSSYREFRVNPPNIPFRAIFLDYLGPFFVKERKSRVKVYILLFTCLWSRSINLKVCYDLSVEGFLRAFQLHIYDFGVPEICHSDLGSQIVAGASIISEFLKDSGSLNFFKEKGIDPLSFTQFPKGCKELGGIVEICVKQVKKLMFSSVGKTVLDIRDFEFHVAQAVSLVNKRPIIVKELLRDTAIDLPPSTLTPEIVVKGYELPCLDVIPELQKNLIDPDWYKGVSETRDVEQKFANLAKVRARLIELYNCEFITNLISQATNKDGRYKPVVPNCLKKGDIVLIKEDLTKRSDYPMARISEVKLNYLGEINELVLFKGKTRELVRRHPSVVIPLLSVEDSPCDNNPMVSDSLQDEIRSDIGRDDDRSRAAGRRGAEVTRSMLAQGFA